MQIFEDIRASLKGTEIESTLLSSNNIVCGFSGGADSTMLLLFLISYCPSAKITAVHVNHMIRGEEADRDEQFCQDFCEEHKVNFVSLHVDVPKIAKATSQGLEECARKERYKVLLSVSKEYDAVLTTAHNSSDNVETVLFNLTRGTGLRGISGIAPVREEQGIFIVRPLLYVTGEEIRSSLKNASVDYVVDSTNSDTAYTRNFIRNSIIPGLKTLNPELEKAVLRLSVHSRETQNFLTLQAERIVTGKFVSREILRNQELPILKECVSILYKNAFGSLSNLSVTHLSNSALLIKSNKNGEISLPNNIMLCVHNDYVFIKEENVKIINEVELSLNKPVRFGDYTVAVLDETGFNQLDTKIYSLFIHNLVNCDNIKGNIKVRTRKSGDTVKEFKTLKKVKNLMCDRKLPQHLRDVWPVFTDDYGIICIPNVVTRDGAFTKSKQTAFHLVVCSENKE